MAPLLIATLDRYDHLRKTIHSLQQAEKVEQTDLYLAIDYPSNETQFFGYNKIIQFTKEITGFRSVKLILREENFGPERNFNAAKELIFLNHDSVVILEDDNVVSPNFILYMNSMLSLYKDDTNIVGVCAYQYPTVNILKSNDYCLLSGMSGWGFGIWKNARLKNKINFDDALAQLRSFKNLIKLAKHKNILRSVVQALNKKGCLYGDIAYEFQFALNSNLRCIFPVYSKVRNIGHDGTGVHRSKNEDLFHCQPLDSQRSYIPKLSTDVDSLYVKKLVDLYFKSDLKSLVYSLILYGGFLIRNMPRFFWIKKD